MRTDAETHRVAKESRWEGWISYVGVNQDERHVGVAGPRVECVDENSRSRARTIKRESMNVDPGPEAAIAAVTNYVWASLLSTGRRCGRTWDDGDD